MPRKDDDNFSSYKDKERLERRKDRRKLDARERRQKMKEYISKQRFLKLSTVFMFALVMLFCAVIIVIFLATNGSEPSALVSGFFDFVKWEFAGLSAIKVAETLGKPKSTKLEQVSDVVKDGADLLHTTAELMNDVSELTSPIEVEDGDPDVNI